MSRGQYVLTALILSLTSLCHAANVTVTTTTDENDGSLGGGAGISLREAIMYSAANDTIILPAGTYLIGIPNSQFQEDLGAEGGFDIRHNLTIQGASAAATIIDGGGIAIGDVVVNLPSSVQTMTVSISGVTIRNGNQSGLVYNQHNLTLTDCAVRDNVAFNGGGVSGFGSLNATNTLFDSNWVENVGSAIDAEGAVVVIGCAFSNNTGPRGTINVSHTSPNALVSNTVFTNNKGPGITPSTEGYILLLNCTITGNTESMQGFSDGYGVASEDFDGGNSAITMTGCTVDNCQNGGVRIDGGGRIATFTNCTIANNGSFGVQSAGAMQLDFNGCTIAANETFGLDVFDPNTIKNTLVADNGIADTQGVFSSGGFNLVENVGQSAGFGGTDILGVDPLLSALAGNGGPTQTMALGAGSAAIDAITVANGEPVTDQRGTARSGFSDIGAYEASVILAASKLAFGDINGGVQPIQVGVAFNAVIEAVDALNTPTAVVANTGIKINLLSGTGVLSGTLTGTISAGATVTTVSGLFYNVPEGAVTLQVVRTSGDNLASGNSTELLFSIGAETVIECGVFLVKLHTQIGKPFSFSASGVGDINFNITGFSEGLTGANNTVSGVPTQGGLVSIKFRDVDEVVLVLLLYIDNSKNFNTPRFLSKPIITPNPVVVGRPVFFSVGAEDGDLNALSFFWEFGDGHCERSPITSHIYEAPGVYRAGITVDDGKRDQGYSFLVNVVLATDAAFQVSKANFKFNFKTPDKNDVSMTGRCPMPSPYPPTNMPASFTFFDDLDVMLQTPIMPKTFTLNAAGVGGTNKSLLQFKTKGGSGSGLGTFVYHVKGAELFDELKTLGFVNNTRPSPGIQIPMQVQLVWNNDVAQTYTAPLTVTYKSVRNKTGWGKK